MKNFVLLAAIVGLSACSLSEEQYKADLKSENCRLIFSCTPENAPESWDNSMDTCAADDSNDVDTTNCTYDADAAQECINELKATDDCELYKSGDYAPSCDTVHTCDAESTDSGEGEDGASE